jgi:hypothetical protein
MQPSTKHSWDCSLALASNIYNTRCAASQVFYCPDIATRLSYRTLFKRTTSEHRLDSNRGSIIGPARARKARYCFEAGKLTGTDLTPHRVCLHRCETVSELPTQPYPRSHQRRATHQLSFPCRQRKRISAWTAGRDASSTAVVAVRSRAPRTIGGT